MRRFCCSGVYIVNGRPQMKKLIIIPILFLVFAANLPAKSYKFVAMDRYYNKAIPIDSIVVRDMKSGEDKTYFADSIYLETITSVEGISGNNGFAIYPNPVEDILNITLPNNSNSPLIIADIAGKIHFKKVITNPKISLNVAGLSTGVYNISYGNRNQRFVKSSAANGSEVSIISSEYSYKSLIKENETQSQFDYRFTVFCNGFKPHNYYSESIEKDSTITLDMASVPSSFDGKHIHFKLFLKDAIFYKSSHHYNSPSTYEYDTTDFNIEFFDTLIYRNGNIKNNRSLKIYPSHIAYDKSSYDKLNLEFVLDTISHNIDSLLMSRSIYKSYYTEIINLSTEDNLDYSFSFKKPIKYDIINNRVMTT